MLLISHLKPPIELFFFPFLFPSYCLFVHRVFSIVSDGCKQSSFVFSYVVFESFVSMCQRCLRCWQVLFLPLFLIHIVCQRRLWDVVPYAWSLVFLVLWSICLSLSLVHFRKGPEYLTRGTAQVFITFIRFLLLSFVSSGFLQYSF